MQDVTETDWATDLPAARGLASAEIERVFAAAARVPGLRSLVIVRDGVLVGERYFHGAMPSHLLPVNSITKSVTSMLIGLALQRGTLGGLHLRLQQLLPEAAGASTASALAGATLQQVLQGRTGQSFDIARARDLLEAPDPVRMALGLPRTPPPRSGWTYNDAAISLLSPVFERAERRSLATAAAGDLFAPLGIRRFAWLRDRSDRVLSHAGLALRSRDLAKLAWMVAQQGRWHDRPVLPVDWVADSTRSHGPADWRAPPMQDVGYGYLWFSGHLHGEPLVWAQGYGGQFALIAPGQRLVVVTAATSPPPAKAQAQMRAVRSLVAGVVFAALAPASGERRGRK